MPSAGIGSAAPSRSTSTCPERFGAFYIDADGEKKSPVMIHRAMFGSMERFTGMLLESTAGHLPLWLAPVQAKVCTIVSEADGYAERVLADLRKAGLRAEADLRNEKINYKVREHSLSKVPALLVVGKREAEEKTVSLRRLGHQQQQVDGARQGGCHVGAGERASRSQTCAGLGRCQKPGAARPSASKCCQGRPRPSISTRSLSARRC